MRLRSNSNRLQQNPDETVVLRCAIARRPRPRPTSPLLIDGCSITPVRFYLPATWPSVDANASSGMWSRSWRLGRETVCLETHQRLVSVSACEGLGLVSGFNVSCPSSVLMFLVDEHETLRSIPARSGRLVVSPVRLSVNCWQPNLCRRCLALWNGLPSDVILAGLLNHHCLLSQNCLTFFRFNNPI